MLIKIAYPNGDKYKGTFVDCIPDWKYKHPYNLDYSTLRNINFKTQL